MPGFDLDQLAEARAANEERRTERRESGLRAAFQKREPHTQTLDERELEAPPDFKETQFIAHLDMQSFKYDRHGSVIVQLVVPPEFSEEALVLRFSKGIPLSVDIQVWKPFLRVDEDDD